MVKSIAHDVTASHDMLRFGLEGVKGDIVGAHPLESIREINERNIKEKTKMVLDLTYGSASGLRMDLDRQILFRFQRPPGPLSSSMLGLEALTGDLDNFAVEDYLNVPQDSEVLRPTEMHHGMEVRLGLSKGAACPNFI